MSDARETLKAWLAIQAEVRELESGGLPSDLEGAIREMLADAERVRAAFATRLGREHAYKTLDARIEAALAIAEKYSPANAADSHVVTHMVEALNGGGGE